jgi:ABC-2 type transport system ATP-binding protein
MDESSTQSTHMISVENVVFEYPGKRALQNVSFELQQGSITALVGPNGAGKTTLLRCLAALDDVFSGQIHINGIDVSQQPRAIHKQVGYLSDFFGLYDNLTVTQCLTAMAMLHQFPQTSIPEKVLLAAERLELGTYLQVKAGNLSRGLRQRLGIAQAIIHEPSLLLLDEPASGLDPEARMSLSDLFLALQKQGMTLIVSSHILAELEDYCSEMLLLRNGKVIEHHSTLNNSSTSQKHEVEIKLLPNQTETIDSFLKLEEISNGILESNTLTCTITGDDEKLHSILKQAISLGLPVYSFAIRQQRLQDVYMNYAQSNEGNHASSK